MSTTSATSNRLTGLASGIDTDSIIKAQLSNEQTRIDKVEQSKQLLQWKQEIYRDIIGEARSFNDKYFSVTSPTSLVGGNNFTTLVVKSSNSNIVSATTTPNSTFNTNFEMKVESLAKEPKKTSEKLALSNGEKVTSETKLSDLGLNQDMTIEVEVNGELKEIKITSDMTLKDLGSEVSNATDGALTATYSELTGKLTLQGKKTGENSSFQIVGVKDITGNEITDTDTLSSLEKLGFGKDDQPIKGSNSRVVITTEDGEVIELNNEENKFTIDGITYDVKEVGTTKITSENNSDKIVELMKSFVEDYNALISKLDSLLAEKKDYDYPPLTDAQKEEMTEDEIEKWEKKAKEGVIRNDTELKRFVSELKNSIFDTVQGSKNILSDFGLSSPKDFSKSGQLVLDETKLRSSLEEGSEKLYNYFNGTNGAFKKTKIILDNYVGKSDSILLKKSGYKGTASDSNNYMTTQLKALEEKIRKLQEVYTSRENALYKKFASMESMMSNLNNQFSMLSGGQY